MDQFGNQELSAEFKELYKKAGEDSSFLLDSETPKYAHLKKKKNIEFIRLVTPTTDDTRLKTILSKASRHTTNKALFSLAHPRSFRERW